MKEFINRQAGLNCAKCPHIHPDNGNCTAVGGFCTAVPAAHCPWIPELRTELESMRTAANSLKMHLEKATAERDGYKIFFDGITACGDCNDCRDSKTCSHKPGIGETTRYNCPLWRGPQKEAETT